MTGKGPVSDCGFFSDAELFVSDINADPVPVLRNTGGTRAVESQDKIDFSGEDCIIKCELSVFYFCIEI